MKRIAKQLLIGAVCLWLGWTPNQSRAQEYEDLPDAPGQIASPAVDATTGVPQREATWRTMPGDFLHDQKDLWTFPLRLVKGHNLVPTLAVAGVTVGLIYADPHVMPYFRTHQRNLDDVNDVFDPMITTGEVIALPAGLLAAGYIRHDDREVNTALLATEAYGDSVVIDLAMKAITRRERPSDIAPNGDYSDTFSTAVNRLSRAAVFLQVMPPRFGRWRRWSPNGIAIAANRGFRSCRTRSRRPSAPLASLKRPTSHPMCG
jgi:hypothetical protein